MKIYRILSLMVLVALMCVPAKAQNDELRHEVAISYGVEPNSVWVDAMTDIIPAMFGQRTDNKKWFGSLGVEYFYHTSPLVGVGGIFTTNVASEDVYSKDELKSYRTKSYFSLMPAVKLNWLRKDRWGLYSKAAAGVYFGRFADSVAPRSETSGLTKRKASTASAERTIILVNSVVFPTRQASSSFFAPSRRDI